MDKKEEYKQYDPGVRMSVPWSTATCNIAGGANTSNRSLSSGENELFIKERTRVHEVFIREQAKTKRLALLLTAFMILASSATVLFAPAGREYVSYWVGAALLIFAAGAAGYGKVWAKHKETSLGADDRESW